MIDYKRFRKNRNVNIQYALYDDDDHGYATGLVLRELLKPEHTFTAEQLTENNEEIWS
ncbi:hypothetical protein AB4865_10115 [Capnocytophaga sp. ARDL2]|uniref:hypothetical protein n=1 Tax=Capnocytophaga sp. ARDL2 TaxID=3238809 RepID=UPI003556FAA8